ncbi:hypothetical protein GJU40_01585 [Bacillus lacus]|uniref:Uncharacterized protein n=1 Tax=Metabacillus lacus TaxID=1983721 RepID=A0A7X2IXC5_9BACI|nr:hypothetical protein [Metabacillus lacus]MRX70858.1 hypothetical protein [Metabacillus lacus]
MKRVAIRVTLEREIWLKKDVWESFGEQLPTDVEDLEMLEAECLLTNTELKGAGVISEFELTD